MTLKEKEKIADDYFGITDRLIKKHGKDKLRPDYFDFIVGRILGHFPADGVEISMILKDRLNDELGFNI
jgi:hypothetical protein